MVSIVNFDDKNCLGSLKYKSCLKYSINKKKLEQMVKDELIKNFDIKQLDRKVLNELIDMIYIIDKNNIKLNLNLYDII